MICVLLQSDNMKKRLFYLLSALLFISCSGDKNVCRIEGRYPSASKGTMLYVTPFDDILSPIDSAVVKNGRFAFEIADTVPYVRFISSQLVIDGNYVVVEPGAVKVEFGGDDFAVGTPANERLNRFMAEKERIVNLRRMCEPEALSALSISETMSDSIKDFVSFASDVFDTYALNEIKANIETPVGYFYLFQSAGVVTPSKLLPLFDRVPVQYRGSLYDVVKNKVETEQRDAAMVEKYLDDIWKSLVATAVGKEYQNFELDDINGGKVLLSDEVNSNRYTLLFFWGGWLDDVRLQLAKLANAYDKYKSKGLQVVGVSLDESVDNCKRICNEVAIDWVQLCNPSGGSAEVAAAYGVTELPVAVLINKRGTIISRMTNVEDVIKRLKELF